MTDAEIEAKTQSELAACKSWLSEPEQKQILESIDNPILRITFESKFQQCWLHALVRHYQTTNCCE